MELPATVPQVAIHHPGYARRSCLFLLPAYDCPPPSAATPASIPAHLFGVHVGTVLAARTVIAANRRGRLTTDRAGSTAITHTGDDILPAGTYYYHADGFASDAPYPVCPSFGEWEFDIDAIPPAWLEAHAAAQPVACEAKFPSFAESQAADAVRYHDTCCIISGYRSSVQTAHLVSTDELAWFVANDMIIYNMGRIQATTNPAHVVDDPRNLFVCRSDLHTNFDTRHAFVLVYKQNMLVPHWVTHTPDFPATYHNRVIMPERHHRLAIEFLWACFAWAVLPLISPFVHTKGHRLQITTDPMTGETSEILSGTLETVELLGDRRARQKAITRQLCNFSTKRKRATS